MNQTKPQRQTEGQQRKLVFAQTVVTLQGAHPTAWDTFMALLAARLEDNRHACVHAPADQMQVAQGRARESEELFREIDAARKLVDEAHAKGLK